MQGFIINEKYLNSDGWCIGSCSDYPNAVSNDINKGFSIDSCKGTVNNCKEVDDDLKICKSVSTN